MVEERTDAVSASEPSRLSSLVTEQGGVGSDNTEDGGVRSTKGRSMEFRLGVGRTAPNFLGGGCGRLSGAGIEARSPGGLVRVYWALPGTQRRSETAGRLKFPLYRPPGLNES